MSSKYISLARYIAYGRYLWKCVASNVRIDPLVQAADWEAFSALRGVELKTFAFKRADYQVWVEKLFPGYLKQYSHLEHKKLQEFYISCHLLGPQPQQVFMDAAGGANGYLSRLDCRRKILQDIRISEATRNFLGSAVEYVEGDARRLPLDDASVDRISCHHSFEHFRGDSDRHFVQELQRILAPGGRCCIVPILTGDRYVEVTDRFTRRYRTDDRAHYLIDPTANVPGGEGSGNFARVYDIQALQERVIDGFDQDQFRVSIHAAEMDGQPVPDRILPCHRFVSGVNYPYRALVIDRLA